VFIKITYKIITKLNAFDLAVSELKNGIENNKKERESQIKEIKDAILDSKKERAKQISDIYIKLDDMHLKILDEANNNIDIKISKMEGKIDYLSSWLDDFNAKEEDKHERNRLIMEGVEATLTTLHNASFNGPVTKSLENINDYKIKKATE
jgi:hypothetical protein